MWKEYEHHVGEMQMYAKICTENLKSMFLTKYSKCKKISKSIINSLNIMCLNLFLV